MECLECSWLQLQIAIGFTIIFSILGALLGIVLIKYPLKPKIEKIFKKNIEYLDEQYFSHMSKIDSYKKRIYEQLESNPNFDPNNGTVYQYPQPVYDEIFRYRGLILNEIETIQSFKKLTGDMDLKHFVKIQQYTITAYTFIGKIGNVENSLFYSPNELERHRFYAKDIVQSFGKSAKRFSLQWKSDFSQVGGIRNVKYRMHEPGDIVGLDVNINNELLLWDPQFSILLKNIRELKSLEI